MAREELRTKIVASVVDAEEEEETVPEKKSKKSKKGSKKSKKEGSGREKEGGKGKSKKAAKKPHRFKSGTRTLMMIHKLQKSSAPILRKLPFQRLVRERASLLPTNDGPKRFSAGALWTLQTAMEHFIVEYLRQTYFVSVNAKRITIMPKDFETALQLLPNHKFLKPFVEGAGCDELRREFAERAAQRKAFKEMPADEREKAAARSANRWVENICPPLKSKLKAAAEED